MSGLEYPGSDQEIMMDRWKTAYWSPLAVVLALVGIGLLITAVREESAAVGAQSIATPTGVPAAAFALTAAALVASHQSLPPSAEPWPPFVMVYRETSKGLGKNGAVGTALVRLEYTDRHHFRTIVLEEPNSPGAVGSTSTYDGRTTVNHRPGYSPDQITSWGTGDPTVPAKWLVPGEIEWLVKSGGYRVTSLGNGMAVASKDQFIGGHQLREERTYREADGIPTKFVGTVDGQEVERFEVVDLQILPRGAAPPAAAPPTPLPVTPPPLPPARPR
jgi:hypothetical protein